jgi:hypothetical protein
MTKTATKSNVVPMANGAADEAAKLEAAKAALIARRENARAAFIERAKDFGVKTAIGAGSLTEMAIAFQARVLAGDLTEGDGASMYQAYAAAMNEAAIARRGVEQIAEKSIAPAASAFATFGLLGPTVLNEYTFGEILTGEKDDDGKALTRELGLYDFVNQVRSGIAKDDLRDGSLYSHYCHVNRELQALAEGRELSKPEHVDAFFELVTTDWLKARLLKDGGQGKSALEKLKLAIEAAIKANKKAEIAEMQPVLEEAEAIIAAAVAAAKVRAVAERKAADAAA